MGYRRDRRLLRFEAETGQRAFPTRGCVDCGETVYFVRSGFDAARYRDAEPICQDCWDRSGEHVKAEL